MSRKISLSSKTKRDVVDEKKESNEIPGSENPNQLLILQNFLEERRERNPDLDTQFILRLPNQTARILRALIQARVSLKKRLYLDIDNDLRHVVFEFDNWIYRGKIFDLPTVVESLKTVDGISFFKTADISQICVCKNNDLPSSEDDALENLSEKERKKTLAKKYLFPHGLTPPLKNARRHRFRKTLPKEYVELTEVEREVRALLRADNEAASVTWDVFYENNEESQKEDPPEIKDCDIFGDQISEDGEDIDEVKVNSSSSDEEVNDQNPGQAMTRDSAFQTSQFLLRSELLKLQNEKQKLIWKISEIENCALKERLIKSLKSIEKDIANKKKSMKTAE